MGPEISLAKYGCCVCGSLLGVTVLTETAVDSPPQPSQSGHSNTRVTANNQ